MGQIPRTQADASGHSRALSTGGQQEHRSWQRVWLQHVNLAWMTVELWRLSRVRSIFGGTTEIMKEIIGRSLGL